MHGDYFRKFINLEIFEIYKHPAHCLVKCSLGGKNVSIYHTLIELAENYSVKLKKYVTK